ncbi:hypothetical protein I0P70_07080 [Pontibacter sp. FD36]|uniref:hypothetical protein n=1 Tax=Pontibacter sp. FD36 TaxID=2789860 RepID=UPI0018A8A04D|nr:hypothetical protein [Pontibacter sp. FD36]MBF8963001.1 hypothetical protein [Pontibacter sp. FD36]
MEHILKNELLYTDDNQVEIYLTYNKDKNAYGLYRQSSEGSKKLDAGYVFIHPYEDERAAALRQTGDFVWIDTQLNETKMDTLDRVIVEALKVKNSTCNCIPHGNFFECDLCLGGVIFNHYNFKLLHADKGLILYEYDTQESTYHIRLTEWEEFISHKVNYVWEKEEVAQELRWIIDTYEQQYVELEDQFLICVLERSEDSLSVRLIPYSVSIEMVSNSTMPTDADSSVMKFNDFRNQGRK